MAAILIPLAISAALTAASTGLEYLLAKKQKIPTIDKGKVDDIRFSLPGYGERIIWSRGRVRGAPTWFWHTPTVDVPITTPGHSGGKGAPKQTVATEIQHQYFKSLAGVFHDGEIQKVRRIWFNSDLVWNLFGLSSVRYEAELATLNGTAQVVNASYASAGRGVTHLGIGGGDNGSVDFSVTVPGAGDYDVAIYYQLDTGSMSFEVSVDTVVQGTVSCPANGPSVIGVQAIGLTLTGGSHVIRLGNTSAHAPNLDCIDVVQTVSFEDGSTEDNRTFTELIDPTASAPDDSTKAWATNNAQPLEVDESGSPQAGTSTLTGTLSKWGNPQIRIYRGTTDQIADPAIVANKGAGNTPAWRGLAYLVIENILLPNAQVPNVTIEWDQGTTAVDQIVEDLYALAGVSSSDLELSALSGLTITGVIRPEQKAIGETLKDLQTRFQFDMVEVDGVVKAILRSNSSPDLTIPYAKLRAHADGSDMPTEDAIIKDIDPRELPYEVQVNYLDPGNDFHNGVQADNRASGPQTQPVSVSLALVDNKNNMKQLASKLLYKPDMEGREFTILTGPEYITAIPGTIIDLTLPNATHRTRVVDAKYGLPAGVCEFQLVRQAASLYSATGYGSISAREDPIAGFPSNTKGIILDGPLFRLEDAGDGTEPVWYIGMCGIGGGSWTGAFLLQETPVNSGNYEMLTSATIPSGIGVTNGTLPSVADTTVWDTTSTLEVNFYYDPQLSNATTGDVEANPNLNLLAIKNPATDIVEVVQFKNATPGSAASPYVANYTLDNFLRGRFETQNNVGGHSSADEVVFIDSTIKPRRHRAADIGKTFRLKFQTSGQLLDIVPAVEEELHGYSLRPPMPTTFVGFFDQANDDLLEEWTSITPNFGDEVYELQHLASDLTTVLGESKFIDPVKNRHLQEYVVWDPSSVTGDGTVTFLADGGITLTGSKDIVSYASAEVVGGFLIEFQIPPINISIPILTMSLFPEDSNGLNFNYNFTWHTGGTWPNYTAQPEHAYYVSGPTINIVPGDRLGIYVRPDGQVEFHLNYSPSAKPVWISAKSVQTTKRYKAYALGNTAQKVSWLRQGPEYKYVKAQQLADNGLGSTDLPPDIIYARVRGLSVIAGGPPSGWVYGTFTRTKRMIRATDSFTFSDSVGTSTPGIALTASDSFALTDGVSHS